MPGGEFDWNVNPINTAFILMSSNELREEYCKLSIDFMKASSRTPDTDEDSRRNGIYRAVVFSSSFRFKTIQQ